MRSPFAGPSGVERWLADLGLAEYSARFAAHRIDIALLSELDDADLREIGVEALGDRKRLLRAIRALHDAGAPGDGASGPTTGSVHGEATVPECRQMTIVFCDLVGSTALSRRLDPEGYRDVLRSFHEAVADAVAAAGGHVAQFLGDGLLAYFGYPRAQEDDALRAVHAAIDAHEAVARIVRRDSARLSARSGIATGLVVVDAIGVGRGVSERGASGDVPNLAARLQAAAGPGGILVSNDTRRLVAGGFELECVGRLALKGVDGPVVGWRVVSARAVASRFEARRGPTLHRLVGRDAQVATLDAYWREAQTGQGSAVLVVGEAGIGKSRLIQELYRRSGVVPHARILLQCSPHHAGSPLYPVSALLRQRLGAMAGASRVSRVGALRRELDAAGLSRPAVESVLRLAAAADVPGAADPPDRERETTLGALESLLAATETSGPRLLVWEDVHWIDPTSAELLDRLSAAAGTSSMLIVASSRSDHRGGWRVTADVRRVEVGRLDREQSAALARSVLRNATLPPEVLDAILARAEGIPLFVEELTLSVVESTADTTDRADSDRTIPATLRDSLTARLDRLGHAKRVAQVGAVIGREFDWALLRAVVDVPPEQLASALDRLARAGLVGETASASGTRYAFKHALIRDAAYGSLLRSQRAEWHRRIAAEIERLDPSILAERPEVLAGHHAEAGDAPRAFELWSRAGDQASARSAIHEAVGHYRAAIALATRLGASRTDAAHAELRVQLKLGALLTQTVGYLSDDSLAANERARALALELGERDSHAQACSGLAAVLVCRGRIDDGRALLEPFGAAEVEQLAPMPRVSRAWTLGAAACMAGRFAQAESLLNEAWATLDSVAPDDRIQLGGVEPSAAILLWRLRVDIASGRIGACRRTVAQALAHAERVGHQPTVAWSLLMTSIVAIVAGDIGSARTFVTRTLDVVDRFGIRSRRDHARMLFGRVHVLTGRVDEGEALLVDAFERYTADGRAMIATTYGAEVGDTLVAAGRIDAAKRVLAICDRIETTTDERMAQAELRRLRGHVHRHGGDGDAALAAFADARDVALGQGAHVFVLRATTDLARQRLEHGRVDDSAALLDDALAVVDRDGSYPDLDRARSLRSALGGARPLRESRMSAADPDVAGVQ